MKRRAFLATSGAGLLAGCNQTEEATESDTPPELVQNQTDSQTERVDTEASETEQVGPEAEITIESDEWARENEAVEYVLANNGEGQSGIVNLVTRWYDEEGNYIGNDQVSIPTLHSDKGWNIEVETTAQFKVAEYDAYVEFETQASYEELETRSVTIDLRNPAITGIVTHDRGEETAIQIQAVTYDSGWITHVGYVGDGKVPEEGDWRFKLYLSQVATNMNQPGTDLEFMFYVG